MAGLNRLGLCWAQGQTAPIFASSWVNIARGCRIQPNAFVS